jgi:hypothetical protein
MPSKRGFASRAQQGYLFAAAARGEVDPAVPRRFARETRSYRRLPERINPLEALLGRGGARRVRHRRNVDFFVDEFGRKRPIRGTEGYDEYMAGDLMGGRGQPGYRERMGYLREMRAWSASQGPTTRGPRGSGKAARAARAARAAAARSAPKGRGWGAEGMRAGLRQEAMARGLERSRTRKRGLW